MDTKGLQLEFISWCKSKKKSPKTEEETKQLFHAFMKEKHPKEYEAAMKLQETLKGAHGMKLQYIKNLKHQCADDEELYYYKKGGSVNCGCKKKEDGGEVKKAGLGCSVVDKFKKMQHGGLSSNINKNDTIHVNGQIKSLTGKSIKDKKKIYKPLTNEEYKKLKNSDKNKVDEKDTARGRLVAEKGMKVEKDCGGSSIVKKFKAARCGSKMKKHQLGGSLNRIPFYLGGTSKGGIKEKSDNTKVQRIPNNGEGVYEQIPVNGWDFVPGIGTYREAKRLDQGDPNASVTRLGISLAGDLAGAGMIGSVAKAAGKASRIQKTLKARGYQLFTKDGSLWFRLPKKIIRGYGDKLYTYEIPNIYGGSSFKTIPTVDYAPAVMAPLVLTLRVPAEAPFFNYSK